MTRKPTIRQFLRDARGNLTTATAIVAVPLIGSAGLAIDSARLFNAHQMVQQVADGAALAGSAAKGTDSQKKAVAQAFIAHNLVAMTGVTTHPSMTISGNDLRVDIATTVQGTLLAVVYGGTTSSSGTISSSGNTLPAVDFTVASKAEGGSGESGDRCVIALNASMANAIYLRGTGDFIADNCDVHANSSSSTALHVQGNSTATAATFTTAGNWLETGAGSFAVTPKAAQSVVADPIALTVTDPGGTAATASVKAKDGNVSLSAVKYGNVTVAANGAATFTPGIHYITGTLAIGSNATLNASGVTLVLLGNAALIDMGSGATLELQAPTSGTYAGFTVVGDPSATTIRTNTVQGGASGYIRGVWYTPKHKLYVTGNGDFNQSSDYFPVIVDNLEVGGNGQVHIGYKAASYGFTVPAGLHYSNAPTARLTQ